MLKVQRFVTKSEASCLYAVWLKSPAKEFQFSAAIGEMQITAMTNPINKNFLFKLNPPIRLC